MMPRRFALLLFVALGAGPASGQEAQIEYEIVGPHRLAFGEMLRGNRVAAGDWNGDGVPDLMTVEVDEQNTPLGLVVFDPVAREVVLTIPYADIVAALGGKQPTRFLGLFHFYNPNEKVAVFRGPGVLGIIAILQGKRAATPLTLPAEQGILMDIDRDGLAEVIIRNPETQSIQVWGTGEIDTAIEEEIAGTLHHLFQNYPNPFRETTTIAYEVEQPGVVTLDVFDVRGRRVRTLVEGHKPVGTHHLVWDGTDAAGVPVASGLYLYRLRVGDRMTSKQALRIH